MGYSPRVSLGDELRGRVLELTCSRRSVLPKSKTESRIKDNLEGDFKLDAEDVKKIDGIDKKMRFNDPSGGFGWNFYADLDGKQ